MQVRGDCGPGCHHLQPAGTGPAPGSQLGFPRGAVALPRDGHPNCLCVPASLLQTPVARPGLRLCLSPQRLQPVPGYQPPGARGRGVAAVGERGAAGLGFYAALRASLAGIPSPGLAGNGFQGNNRIE